jgi:hypothetical protein
VTDHHALWEESLARVETALAVGTDPVTAARLTGAARAYREALYGEPLMGRPESEADLWRWEGVIAARRLLVAQAAR